MVSRLVSLLMLGAAILAFAGCQEHAAPATAPETHGTRIRGRVTWKGNVPPEWLLATDGAEDIMRIRGGEPIYSERCVVNPEGGLANVFVFVKGKPDVPIPPPPSEPVVLAARIGVYAPHAVALRVGQTLHFELSGEEGHVPHSMSMFAGGTWQRMRRADEVDYTFEHVEIFKVKCDNHGWMSAWVGVFNHPWFAVTGTDGTFELPGLPPRKYKLKAWHEKGGEREADIEIGSEGEEVRAEFEFGPG